MMPPLPFGRDPAAATLTVASYPSRIVCLTEQTTETLYLLVRT